MKKIMFWTSGIIVFIALIMLMFIGYILNIQKTFSSMDKEIKEYWPHFENHIQGKFDKLPSLFNENNVMHIKGVHVVLGFHEDLISSHLIKNKIVTVRQAERNLSYLIDSLLKHKKAKSNEEFQAMIEDLQKLLNTVKIFKSRYNQAVNLYNKKLDTKPEGIVAMFLSFKTYSPI